MLLTTMQREIDGEAFIQRGVMESAIASIVSPLSRPATYRKAIEYLVRGNALKKGESYASVRRPTLSAKDEFQIRQVAAAFNILKKTNFYDIMAKTLIANTSRR